MTASMNRKGNCWDNAPTESFFNSLKNERVHGTTYTTRADAQADLFEYIEVFYNRSPSPRWKAKFDGHLREAEPWAAAAHICAFRWWG